MTDFGTVVTPDDVGRALEQRIRTWHRTAFDVIAQGRGFSRRLPKIASYRHTNVRPEKWNSDALPCCVIVSGDADRVPRTDAYAAFFTPVIAVIHGTRDQQTALKAAKAMGAALALMFVNVPDLGDIGEVSDWGGFRSSEMPPEEDRLMAMSAFELTVHVPNALTVGMWPTEPLPDPPGDQPPTYPGTATAEHINVTVDQLAQEG